MFLLPFRRTKPGAILQHPGHILFPFSAKCTTPENMKTQGPLHVFSSDLTCTVAMPTIIAISRLLRIVCATPAAPCVASCLDGRGPYTMHNGVDVFILLVVSTKKWYTTSVLIDQESRQIESCLKVFWYFWDDCSSLRLISPEYDNFVRTVGWHEVIGGRRGKHWKCQRRNAEWCPVLPHPFRTHPRAHFSFFVCFSPKNAFSSETSIKVNEWWRVWLIFDLDGNLELWLFTPPRTALGWQLFGESFDFKRL